MITVDACVGGAFCDTWLYRRSSASSTCPLHHGKAWITAPVQGSDTRMGDLDRNAMLRMNDQSAVHALIRCYSVSSCAWMPVSARFSSGVYCLGLDVGRSWAAVTRHRRVHR